MRRPHPASLGAAVALAFVSLGLIIGGQAAVGLALLAVAAVTLVPSAMGGDRPEA